MDGEQPPKLLCPWCEIDEGREEPLFPHEHHYGQIPLTPCRACSVSNHDECDPRAPWFCVCDCGLKGEE